MTWTRSGTWRALVVVAGVLVGAIGLPSRAVAQAVRLGVVMDLPRQALAATWDDEDPHQLERGYCIVDWSYGVYHVSRKDPVQDDSIFRVFRITPAEVSGATPVSVEFDCPAGVPELHVHTPTTCMGDDNSTCHLGGLNAYSCQPSRGDYEKLVRRQDPFGVIQCDRRSFRFYFPSDYLEANSYAMAHYHALPRPTGNMTAAMRSAGDTLSGATGGSGARAQQVPPPGH